MREVIDEVADKKQSFFKPLLNASERGSVIKAVVQSHSLLQIKPEEVKVSDAPLSVMRPTQVAGDSIVANLIEGPPFEKIATATIVFEVSKSMYFSAGSVIKGKTSDYFVDLKKIFELQRRDSFRVTIQPQLIKAKFIINLLNSSVFGKDFRVIDLSAGGLGLAVPEDKAALLKQGSTLHGIIIVGSHSPIDVFAEVKFQRKVADSKPAFVHVGCQFLGTSLALSQRIAFLVNDCHRVTFARLAK